MASLAFYLFSPTGLKIQLNMSTHVRSSIYSTAGENVAATAVSGSEITVTWDQPPYIYVELNATAGPSPSLNGSV